jgi:hypothetical protein
MAHWLALAGAAALMAGCTSAPPPPSVPAPVTDAPPPTARPAPPIPPGTAPAAPPNAAPPTAAPPRPSEARSPRDYRRDAATHLYVHNSERIYKGRLPPMLYAVGVLQLELDRRGDIQSLHWLRAPRHAPEVISEIERTVRRAAPYPAPLRLGKVTYTETWLWDQSGRFQLDTLTEGQD